MDIAEVIEEGLDEVFGFSGKFVNVACQGNFSK